MLIKLKAFLIHFSISLSIFMGLFFTTLLIWYPSFYFSANGAWDALFVVTFVDVGLGPLLTFVLYKPGKPGLKLDLSLIVLFQLSALVWGIWVLYSERPVLTVYYEDAFFCLSQTLAKTANAEVTAFEKKGVIPQAFLPEPKTLEEQGDRVLILNQLPDDRSSFPPYVFGDKFEAITKDNLSKMMAYELDLTRALENPEHKKTFEAFLDKHKEATQNYAYFPLRCSATEHLAAVNRQTGTIVDSVAIPLLNTTLKSFLKQQ